jgi:hypothetical protein
VSTSQIAFARAPLLFSPKSVLGKMLPCARDAERGILIALKSYFDGSYSGQKWTKCNQIALGGFAADDKIMEQFESDWGPLLGDNRHRPAAPYLHMKELRSESRKSPFSSKYGWNDARRKYLVLDVVNYIRSLDKAKSRVFLSSVDVGAWLRKKRSGARIASPIRYCTHFCPHYAMAWFARDFPGVISEAHFFFDRNEPFFDDFRALRKHMENKKLEIAGIKETWQLIKSVTETDSLKAPELQVADMLAWSQIRQYTAPKGSFLYDLAVTIKSLSQASWGHWDESNLDEARIPW